MSGAPEQSHLRTGPPTLLRVRVPKEDEDEVSLLPDDRTDCPS